MTARAALIGALVAALVAALATAAGCSLVPDVGPRLAGDAADASDDAAGSCDNTDSRPSGQPVSFINDIQPLISRGMGGCGCHLNGTKPGGLDLSSLSTLRMGGFNSGPQIIVAGDPCSSILYQKLSDTPPFGSRMPRSGPPFWTTEELQLLHDWIAEGAIDN